MTDGGKKKLMTFLVAGHETSAGNMTWSIYTLATHPEIQDKLRVEIVEFLENTKGKTPQWAEIESLRYLNNFCREVLRRYGPCEPNPPSIRPWGPPFANPLQP